MHGAVCGEPAALAGTLGPTAIAIHPALGHIAFSEQMSHAIRVVRSGAGGDGAIGMMAGVVGSPGDAADGDDATSSPSLFYPSGIAFHPVTLDLYLADYGNGKVRRIALANASASAVDGAYRVFDVAGIGATGSSGGDGGDARLAQLNGPHMVAFHPATRDLYISEIDAVRVRVIAAATGVITTLTGGRGRVSTGDGGAASAAAIEYPWGLVFVPAATTEWRVLSPERSTSGISISRFTPGVGF